MRFFGADIIFLKVKKGMRHMRCFPPPGTGQKYAICNTNNKNTAQRRSENLNLRRKGE
jgi:hypothetical protein